MVTQTPDDEAKEILNVIDRYFPKVFEGKESIKWLHKHTTQGNQIEWGAIFFEEYCRPLLTNFLGGWNGVRITKGSRIDYQRNYNWDLKVHSIIDSKRKPQHDIILNDKTSMERIISQESGIGFIVADVKFDFDYNKKLLKWRDIFEKKSKPHSAKSRIMKSKGRIIDLQAIFIKNIQVLNSGLDDWISVFKQGRQPDGSSRNPKYMIKLNKVPKELFIQLNKKE